MRLLIITQFSALGGSSRIQVIQFFPFFEKAGIGYRHLKIYSDRFYRVQNGIVEAAPWRKKMNFFLGMLAGFLKKAAVVFAASRYDAVLIQREVFPRSWYWLMRRVNPRIIYEIEDTIYEINPFWQRGGSYDLALRYQARMCRNMMRYAWGVIAENEYLGAEARHHNPRVFYITAPIDTDRYHPSTIARDNNQVTVGWIGSPATSYMLKNLELVFAEISRRHPGAILKAVGAPPEFSIEGIRFVKKEWRAADEPADLESFDIGLMPLDDTPFNRGRLGYKMIQYMAVGIPVVAADVGLNRTVIKDGENGFLVKTPEEWTEKLSLLISDAALRARLGADGRKMAEKTFSLAEQSQSFLAIIKQCARL